MNINQFLTEIINEDKLIYGVLSGRKKKASNEFNPQIKKVKFKYVKLKEQLYIQIEEQTDKQAFHRNISKEEAKKELEILLKNGFKQANIFTTDSDYQVFINKDHKIKILKKKPTKKKVDINHNREKNYILKEQTEFLYKLGITNKSGKIFDKKYDKYKQLNRYLELVEDCFKNYKKDKELMIIDFGCGKSYLTFALYHYLVKMKKIKAKIIGLDLKREVIEFCNKTAKDLGYNKLKFIHGDIKNYDELNSVDMVITLHACDTATDDALVKAVNWGADIILSVPCCQHELLSKIHNPIMEGIEKYGIIKERMSSLITDSIRANILEILGYNTQILEFIDMEHTPKNIMIRAIKNDKKDNTKAIKNYKDLTTFWNVKPYIQEAMGNKLNL
ncbi:SAM-dependent methyltransferase [Clostridiaceae bacterium M8S5]|nr:SAM-dependent methyltransferase [Clostridiaceae bacterium M8S5]